VKHRRPGAILYGYVARELVRPTLLSLVGLTAVVLTKDLLGYSDLVINRGFGADAVALIAFYQVVPLLTMIFPLAVLMGALFAMGRMGSDLEILRSSSSRPWASRPRASSAPSAPLPSR